jgi:hypothetical protein
MSHDRAKPPRWRGRVGFAVLAILLSVVAWAEMLRAHPETQNGDGQFFYEMIDAMRVSIIDYHELPLWNPYQCGGVPLWDNPQGVSAAPFLWLTLPLGTTRGIEVWCILHSAIGFVCMWLLARRELGMSRGAALVASAAFAFAGVHNQHLTGGHLAWASYLYYPLALLLWRRAERDARCAVGLGILVAWTMHEGGTYPLPHLALLLGLETLTRVWPPRRLVFIARAAGIVLVVGFCVGASRFLPVIDQLRAHARHLGDEHDRMTWQTLSQVFLAADHGRDVPGQEYAWTEFGDYVGPIILGLSVVGICLRGKRTVWMLVPLIGSFLLMLGHQGPWAPWTLLKLHVYPFEQMRVPSRFVACVTVFIAAYAGVAIDALAELPMVRRLPGRVAGAVRVGTVMLGLVGAACVIRVGVEFGAQFFTSKPADVHVQPASRLYLGGRGLAEFIDQPRQHRGRLDCWEEWAFEQGAPLVEGDVPQARATDSKATIRSVTRTQNTFTIDVHAAQPTRLLINSGYDRGWRSSVGDVVRNGKQLAIDVPTGDHVVLLKYWPHGLTLGFALAGSSLLAIAALYLYGARRAK